MNLYLLIFINVGFYAKMNDPKSEEIRVLFEQFVQKGFKPKSSRQEMSKQVKEIVELMFENFADVWKVKSKVILEGMEELVTKNLYKILRYFPISIYCILLG